jgi:hypothetical protein
MARRKQHEKERDLPACATLCTAPVLLDPMVAYGLNKVLDQEAGSSEVSEQPLEGPVKREHRLARVLPAARLERRNWMSRSGSEPQKVEPGIRKQGWLRASTRRPAGRRARAVFRRTRSGFSSVWSERTRVAA